MFHLDFTPSWLILSFALLFTVFLIIWILKNLRNTYYSKTTNTILTALRIVALIIFVLILTDMKIERTIDKQVPPRVAFLWDLSESILLSDSSFTVDRILLSKEYKDLERQISISHICNMKDPRILNKNRLRQLPVNEGLSDNSELLNFANDRDEFDEIVLVSDGNSYLGEKLESMQFDQDLQVNVIAVGQDMKTDLPILSSLTYPPYVSDSDSLEMSWTLSNNGEEDLICDLLVRMDGKELSRHRMSVPGQRMITMSKVYPPAPAGVHEWTFIIPGDEANDQIGSERILVHDSRIDILVVNDPPDQDIAMMASILKEDQRMQIYDKKTWQIEQNGQKPELVIQSWNPGSEQRLYDDVPSILIYRDNQNSYQYEDALLIEDHKPYVTFTTDLSLNDVYWSQLPPIQVARMDKIANIVLQSENESPVIMDNPRQQSIIINAAGLWRWNMAGYLKDWDGIYRHLIIGMAESLIERTDKSYIAFDQPAYTGSEYRDLSIKINRYNKAYLNGRDVTENIRLTDSNYIEMRRMIPNENGHVTINLSDRGDYVAIADIFSANVLLESDTATVHIEENRMENRVIGCNEKVLTALAEHHHGQLIHIEDLSGLENMIRTDKQWTVQRSTFIARKSYVLYILMFLLLCADWVIRKRSGGI